MLPPLVRERYVTYRLGIVSVDALSMRNNDGLSA
jgi:hypothetical protein